MGRRLAAGLRAGLLAAMIFLFLAPAMACGEVRPPARAWVATGFGLSPARYGSDRNGSFVGIVSVGRALTDRASAVATAGYSRFAAHERTEFAPLSVGVRLHLSPAPDLEGGPYASMALVLCRASWRGVGSSKSAMLYGAAVGVGTEIRLSARLGLDWGARFVRTTRAHGFWPDRLTLARDREGLARGYMCLGLTMRR